MRQFLDGSEEAFAELEQRATGTCVRFAREEMPLVAIPRQAAVAFEIDLLTGVATLLVQRDVAYAGPSLEIRKWLAAGEKQFASFASLKAWIRGHLRHYFDLSVEVGGRPVPIEFTPRAIRDMLTEGDNSLELDQDEMQSLLLAVLARTPSEDPPS